MKLNHDCVRDTLLYLESNLELNKSITLSTISIPKHSLEDITYTVQKLAEAEFLNIKLFCYDNEYNCFISSISYKGHEYLDNIRDDGIWKETKKILSKFTSVSLSFTATVAAEVLSNVILASMGIPKI